ncbi:DegV family protein [uncultured Anaerococcus sp.]|uniref:DegV family protein n=1 Tax=uncultured Anaerococcus sp. TaxID=293428 RepID=UPI00288922BC|nr:DegV family protein [uncultured Anaerococcus sp.]
MEKIAILTDSASNIEENISEGIFVVPLYVNFKTESKKDLVEISPVELFERMDKENASTSAPSIDDFAEKIKFIKELGYTKILAIGVSQALSGTYNAMRIALEDGDMEYVLIDSKNITMTEGLLVMYAKSLVTKGLGIDEISKNVKGKIKDLRLFATVSDLKYMIRGGRLSAVEGLLGGTLRINPVLTIEEKGTIGNYKSVMGRKRAVNFIARETQKALAEADGYYLALAYGKDVKDIAEIKEKLGDLIKEADFYIESSVTAVLGCHSGPSTYVVSFLKL